MSKMEKFSNAKVGDKVYSLLHGHGVIEKIFSHVDELEVTWQGNTSCISSTFTFNGYWIGDNRYPNPILYWNKPTISDDPPPKRKVKKVGYVNVYQREDGVLSFGVICETSIPPDKADGLIWKHVSTGKVEYVVEE